MTYPDGIDALVNVNATDSLAAGGHAARHNSTNTALEEVRDWLAAPTQSVRASDYTFTADDVYRLTVMTGGSAVTIPPASSVNWDAGTQLAVLNQGSATVTVTAGSGVTLNGSGTALAQYAGGVAVRTGSDEFTFVPFSGAGNAPSSVEYLVIAGGGGGGGIAGTGSGGGGGAGGLLTDANAPVSAGISYTITIGAGGASETSGSSSSFDSIASATGGGRGRSGSTAGDSGGSGGGAGTAGSSASGGAGTAGQGNNGGSSSSSSPAFGGGGGGGAGAVGGNGSGSSGGAGGAGVSNSITGSAVFYAGGGGGGRNDAGTAAAGGSGVGGAGSVNVSSAGTSASPSNRGSGGGGANNATGGSGSSGVVIIRQALADSTLIANTTGSPLINTVPANSPTHIVYIFNASGTIEWAA
jgi:hypothetical protein